MILLNIWRIKALKPHFLIIENLISGFHQILHVFARLCLYPEKGAFTGCGEMVHCFGGIVHRGHVAQRDIAHGWWCTEDVARGQ